jgi:tRNA threonylcarbamoyladenosine biosynthesis protein TsaE
VTPDPISAQTSEADQTRAMAEALARTAVAGDLILLVGEMGTGKTAFAQGFGFGLGVTDQITSPTFTIVHEYAGRLALHHLDAYRLEHLQEVAELGIAEMLDEQAVMLVEWGDVILPALPADYLEVRIAYGPDDDDRLFSFSPVGSRWTARHRLLGDVVQPWRRPSPPGSGEAEATPC